MVPLPPQPEFVPYGPAHLGVITLLVIVSAVLSTVVRYSRSDLLKWAVRWGLVVVLLGTEFLTYAYTLTRYGGDFFLQYSLPLHACGMSVYLCSYMLITKKQVVFEIAYFWGLAGTTQAIFTPALSYGFPSIQFFQFFIAHSTIIIAVLVATFGMRLRPRFKGLWVTYLLTWGLVLVVGGLNAVLDGNYMYLCRPPAGNSPFYFLPWPWYILFQGALALVLFTLLWLPFGLSKKRTTNEHQ